MTGRDFVACAEKFAKGSSEAELRSAVSRAYYRTPARPYGMNDVLEL
jgi:hypothetical protein